MNHDLLWEALERKGISGNFLNLFKFLYSKLKSCMKLNAGLTEYFDCFIESDRLHVKFLIMDIHFAWQDN